MDLSKVGLVHELCNSGRSEEALEHLRELASQSVDSLEKAGYLLAEAACLREAGNFAEAQTAITRAKEFAGTDPMACAQIDFFAATLMIDEDKRENGLEALSRVLKNYSGLFQEGEGREMYEEIQMQRGFTLMHLSKHREARPILEEAASFQLEAESKSRVHCHLGRCYHELAEHHLAKEQFLLAQSLSVAEDWEATFHYYFGYTLYELRDFASARREFILCLQSSASGPPLSYTYRMLAATSRKLAEYDQARLYEKMAGAGHR